MAPLSINPSFRSIGICGLFNKLRHRDIIGKNLHSGDLYRGFETPGKSIKILGTFLPNRVDPA